MERQWSASDAGVDRPEFPMLEFPVQRWMSVDEDDGDVVREIAATHAGTASPGVIPTPLFIPPAVGGITDTAIRLSVCLSQPKLQERSLRGAAA